MKFNQMFDDSQPDAYPAMPGDVLCTGLVESLEYPLLILNRNANSIIPHTHQDYVASIPGSNLDVSPLWCKLDSV
jgi:hypothetical protein